MSDPRFTVLFENPEGHRFAKKLLSAVPRAGEFVSLRRSGAGSQPSQAWVVDWVEHVETVLGEVTPVVHLRPRDHDDAFEDLS